MARRRILPGWKILRLIGLAVVLLGAGVAAWRYFRSGAALQQVTAEKNSVESRLAETQALTVEKDSLLDEVLETTTLLTDINQAVTALQGGRNAPALSEAGGPPLTARQARVVIMSKIDSLHARLDSAQAHMGASLDRVRQMSGVEVQLRKQIADYEVTVASVRKLLTQQQGQLASLGTEVVSLRAENQQLREAQQTLVAAQGALQDSLTDVKESANTVYWIAGPKASLLELGVVVEEGKGKFLVFGKGKSVVPGRSLQATDFTPVNKLQTATITLPKPNIRYRILTRQNLTAVGNALDKDGHVRGTIEITDPSVFWEPSAYLILIEDN